MLGVEPFIGEGVPWAGAAGIIGVVAFALKLLISFQRDFTERYADEVKRQATRIVQQDSEIARLHLAIDALRHEHQKEVAVERRHRESCEHSLAVQGRHLEALQLRLEGLDRRKQPDGTDP